MTATQKTALVVVGALIAGAIVGLLLSGSRAEPSVSGVYNNVTNYFKEGIVAGGGGQFSVSSVGAILTSANIVQTAGVTAVNDLVQGSAGYAVTLSTATGGTNTLIGANIFALTPAQWCVGTSVLIPASNTTTVTLQLPAATTTYAACGATAGSWAHQIIDNESSFTLTYATTTGGNGITFFTATGTTYTLTPKVFASTTEDFMGLYTSSSALNAFRTSFYRPTGF